MAVLSKARAFIRMYPVTRGMMSYSVIWPTSCLIQQLLTGTDYHDLDYMRALRFSLYGGLYVAPTLYAWIRMTTHIWPRNNLRTAVTKGIMEQFSYGPFALCSFFYVMTLLEGKGMHAAAAEVDDKFWDSYKVGFCVWPVLQTINHSLIKEKNKVTYVSICSLGWTCFLAYMHQKKAEAQERKEEELLALA